MDTLHKSGYSIEAALSSLVPASGPVLCRDEMEEWSASEANLFEESLDKYGKDFADIRKDFVSVCYQRLSRDMFIHPCSFYTNSVHCTWDAHNNYDILVVALSRLMKPT